MTDNLATQSAEDVERLARTSESLLSALRTLAAEHGPIVVLDTVIAMSRTLGAWTVQNHDRITMNQGYAVQDELTFEKNLEHLINFYSRESGSNTPDFILSEFLVRVLNAYDETTLVRDMWYIDSEPPSRGPKPNDVLESFVNPVSWPPVAPDAHLDDVGD